MKYVLFVLLILLSFACENQAEEAEYEVEEIYQEKISNNFETSIDTGKSKKISKHLEGYTYASKETLSEIGRKNVENEEKWEKQYGKYWRIIRQDVTRPYLYISLKYIDAFSDEKIFTTDIETYRRYSNDSKAINDHLKYSLLDKAEKEFLKYKSSCKVIERECHLFITYEEASEHRFNLKNK
jgi:hypothetical protein